MHGPRSNRRLWLLVAVVTLAPGLASAQARDVKRPRLGSDADTNDARVYYDRGIALLEKDPKTAADAFYWATRLEPGWAEALYARRVAELMASPYLLLGYLRGERGVIRSKDARRLDSLELRAQRINPFFPRDLDEAFYTRFVMVWAEEYVRQGGAPLRGEERSELEFFVTTMLRSSDVSPWLRAHVAESRRRFPEALRHYRDALGQSGERVEVHRDLAHLFFMIGSYDSALAHLRSAVEELQSREADRLVRVYESKELFQHAIGVVHEASGDLAAAREAYGRAMQEDLSYYPAHVRLGLLALAAGDTAQALQEMNLAIEVAPDEPTIRLTYAVLLAQAGRLEEALPQLRRVTELEPYFAVPHYVLGWLGERLARRDQALEGYRGFLTRASRHDARRSVVVQRIADLEMLPP